MSDSSAPPVTRGRGLTFEQQVVKNRLREKSTIVDQRMASVCADSAFLPTEVTNFDAIAEAEEAEDNPYENTTRLPFDLEMQRRATAKSMAADKSVLPPGMKSDEMTEPEQANKATTTANTAAAGGELAKHLSLAERWRRYKFISGPSTLVNIIMNEGCERFSYFSLKAVLTLYFTQVLGWPSSTAVVAFSIFSSLGGFAAILGAVAADGFWGRYKTILYFSMVYVLGGIVLAASSALKSSPGTIMGLFLICLGGGGIKPAVSAFGADQYNSPEYQKQVTEQNGGMPLSPAQKYREVQSFFSAFYISINIGSVFSLVMIPPLRTEINSATGTVQWGYCVSFAIPAFFLTVATLIFWSGSSKYYKVVPAGSVLVPVFKILWRGLGQVYWFSKPPATKAAHWLDRVRDQPGIDNSHVDNAKALTRIIPVFATIIPFWSLYSQEGSSWAQQANKMERGFLEPEQMHLLNPVLIIVLLPVFTKYIYPLFPRLTSLRKIGLGMVFSAAAFMCSYLVQVGIDDAKANGEKISIAWQIPQFTLDVVAELLISVTGLTYAYQQAPPQMKSVISACWGLTNSFGNLLTAAGVGSLSKIFAGDAHPEQKIALFFTGLMAANVFIYSIVAYYTPDEGAPKEEAKPSDTPATASAQSKKDDAAQEKK